MRLYTSKLNLSILLILAVALFNFLSCEKENTSVIEDQNTKKTSDLNWYKTTSRDAFSKSEVLKNHIYQNLKEDTRALSRMESDIYNFSIDENRVTGHIIRFIRFVYIYR